ncbi:Mite allergen Der p 3 [Papilio machaon]|uniref:Mite allergen Der p 3 n=1 Tax=Papilio machaon TaxID=76193 RepID=A0A0N1PKI2_PAPMA|nr:Mite allergen Der p 3 [Papilio machaon]
MYILFIVILSSQCSGKHQPLRVYGGEDADQGAYPYVVRLELRYTIKMANGSIFDTQRHLCTASALSSTWAITAAHCLTDLGKDYKRLQSGRLVIRYGSVHSLPNDKNTFIQVVLVIPHPMYVRRKTKQYSVMKNDIGLIKTNPMPLNRFIKLSPVDFHTLYGHEVVFCGFGITTKINSENKTKIGTTLKLKKPLQIVKAIINKCKKKRRPGPFVCLGHRCGSTVTSCPGDSGGPVIHSSGIVAVLSLGYNKYCNKETLIPYAGVTCPVGPYVEWIASYVRN